jgi:MFS family permease
MKTENVKVKHFLVMAVLGLSCVALMNDMVIIPVVDYLFADFSDTNIAVLNFILSGPVLIAAFFSLLCGKLMYIISKKTLMIIGFSVFTAASIFCDAVHNAFYMVVMRSLIGASVGIIGVVSFAIITDVFFDVKARSTMMGIYNGLMALAGAALGWVAGIVGANSWRSVFRVYLVSIPILVLIILFLPKDSVSKDGAGGEPGEEAGPVEKMPWAKLLIVQLAFIVYNNIYCIVYYQISMIVAAKGIGDAVFVGMLAALGTVGSFVACTAFGLYFNKLKRFTIVFGYAGMAICYWMIYSATSTTVVAIACTFLGAAYGLGISYYSLYTTIIVPPSLIPMALSVSSFVLGLGSSLSTYSATFLEAVLKAETILDIIPALIIILVVCTVLSLIFSFVERKSVPSQTEQV